MISKETKRGNDKIADVKEDDLLKSILESDAITSFTKKNYIERISAIFRKAGEDITLLAIIINPKKYIELFRSWYAKDSSYKAHLSAILGIFRYNPDLQKRFEHHRVFWMDAFNIAKDAVDKRYDKNSPTERQVEGYVPYDSIEAERDLQPKGSINRVLLGMYTYIRPMRCEYARVAIYQVSAPNDAEPNHILLKSGKLIIADFKTKKFHDPYNINLPKPLLDDIKESLINHPRAYLFENANNEPFSHCLYSAWTMKMFKKMFGKPLSVALIRHSLINSLDFNKLTIEEKKEIATQMGHTVATQDRYRLIF